MKPKWRLTLTATKNITETACQVPIRNRARQYTAVSYTLGIITGAIVMERFLIKLYLKMELGPDDWLTLATTIVGAPQTAINQYGLVANGLGRDVWTLPFDKVTRFGLYFYIMEVFYFVLISMNKITMLSLYLRIFPTRAVRNVLWGSVAVTALYGISFVFAAIFQCIPIKHFWEKWDGEHEGTCLDINAIGWSNAAIGVALDIWIIAIPLAQLPKMSLTSTKKVWLAFAFLVGAL